ncbi:DUF3392 domain-containing protein [Vibrio albus]|uniref:DUF3392 domain-containing protein n=1 Tax=Vibrio albus TaxID=2200953 RepID=A0A2U3BB73_9VIBR|nr:DUF3392 domain-containing protein [Vibrio albus]PWI34023.1 DUF3392 domain-containing protein [Vibrio albus]
MLDFLTPVGRYLIPYTTEISTALIACLLVMFGGEINRLMRNLLSGQHFIIRTCAFILLNAFGYGLLIVKATPYLAHTLKTTEPGMMFAATLLCFLVIGIWAQKNRHV